VPCSHFGTTSWRDLPRASNNYCGLAYDLCDVCDGAPPLSRTRIVKCVGHTYFANRRVNGCVYSLSSCFHPVHFPTELTRAWAGGTGHHTRCLDCDGVAHGKQARCPPPPPLPTLPHTRPPTVLPLTASRRVRPARPPPRKKDVTVGCQQQPLRQPRPRRRGPAAARRRGSAGRGLTAGARGQLVDICGKCQGQATDCVVRSSPSPCPLLDANNCSWDPREARHPSGAPSRRSSAPLHGPASRLTRVRVCMRACVCRAATACLSQTPRSGRRTTRASPSPAPRPPPESGVPRPGRTARVTREGRAQVRAVQRNQLNLLARSPRVHRARLGPRARAAHRPARRRRAHRHSARPPGAPPRRAVARRRAARPVGRAQRGVFVQFCARSVAAGGGGCAAATPGPRTRRDRE
jgi:hypothetical protein